MNIFTERLVTIMTEKQVPQWYLAYKTDIDKSLISRYVNGKHIPHGDTAAKIADALGVSADYLLGLKNKSNKREVIEMKDFKLCFVDGDFLYFTDNFDKQNGDDWGVAPYESNAGAPYDIADGDYKEGHGHIRIIAFSDDRHDIKRPCDHFNYNSPYSVKQINKGAIAWLTFKDEALQAGTTLTEAMEWLKSAGCKHGELV